ncbi:hypothetical protein M8998_08320 [Sphingobacterium sp. lm-10]|nr:hypothetical protein [Sphingobacterium sp. lm-10]MCL7987941.1 hypothetical protein [Sphingobacterium sp. lm-10]
MKTLTVFKHSLADTAPSNSWSAPLKALWYDGKGDWNTAHALVDQLNDQAAAHVHAYLHRVEGDQWNANYWYGRAKQPPFEGSLAQEWEALVQSFL